MDARFAAGKFVNCNNIIVLRARPPVNRFYTIAKKGFPITANLLIISS